MSCVEGTGPGYGAHRGRCSAKMGHHGEVLNQSHFTANLPLFIIKEEPRSQEPYHKLVQGMNILQIKKLRPFLIFFFHLIQ